ncbi:MAG: O-antigen ligase family protein [Crocinitomicaceae bacterium]
MSPFNVNFKSIFSESRNLVRFLFFAWLLTLPFGSNIGGFSIGLLTIYPNLIVTLAILPFCLIAVKKFNRFEIIILSFLFIWLVYALISSSFNGFPPEAIFDVRSLIMQFLFGFVLIGSFHILDKEKFLRLVKLGVRCFLFVLLFSGIFEFLTGIHFAGHKTTELLQLPVGNTFYAPMFIYDNQNDYLTYLIFIFLILNIIDEKIQTNSLFQILVTLVIFVFSTFADSNFAKIISGGILVFLLVKSVFFHLKINGIKSIYPYLIVLLLLGITIFNNRIFLGPKYENGANYRLNGVSLIEKREGRINVVSAKDQLSKKEQKMLIDELDSINTKSPTGSVNLRKNLILNGIDFIQSAPILGIGAGGYAQNCKAKQNNYFVHTHTSPHNFPIEIISQFGLFGWLYFSFLIFIFVSFFQIRNTISSPKKIALTLLMVSLPLLWMMPSSYLYLTINWLLLPILAIQLTIFQTKRIDDI